MGVSYITISAACTVLSFIGLQLWTELSIDNLRSEKIIGENPFQTENAGRVVDLLLGSYVTVGLLANFALNVFVLLILFLKVSLLFILGALCCKGSKVCSYEFLILTQLYYITSAVRFRKHHRTSCFLFSYGQLFLYMSDMV